MLFMVILYFIKKKYETMKIMNSACGGTEKGNEEERNP